MVIAGSALESSICREAEQGGAGAERLQVADDSRHGVSLVSLQPDLITISGLKVGKQQKRVAEGVGKVLEQVYANS